MPVTDIHCGHSKPSAAPRFGGGWRAPAETVRSTDGLSSLWLLCPRNTFRCAAGCATVTVTTWPRRPPANHRRCREQPPPTPRIPSEGDAATTVNHRMTRHLSAPHRWDSCLGDNSGLWRSAGMLPSHNKNFGRNNNMKRRQFFKGAAVAAGASTLAAPAIAQSEPTIRWRCVSSTRPPRRTASPSSCSSTRR